MKANLLAILALLSITPITAQSVPFNDIGITIGHVHLYVHDMEAHQQFWHLLGGKDYEDKALLPQRVIEFPGIYLILRKQDANSGTAGSVINHIGFNVQNMNDWLPKWTAAGINIHKVNSGAVMLTGPDDVRVEIIEDKSIATPIAMHHIHLYLPYPEYAQAWYIKVFGAVAKARPNANASGEQFLAAKVPGAEITFTKTNEAQLPSRGRTIDHIGFYVKDMDEFVKRLAGLGVQIESPVRGRSNDPNYKATYMNDPWGIRIELNQNPSRTFQSPVNSSSQTAQHSK